MAVCIGRIPLLASSCEELYSRGLEGGRGRPTCCLPASVWCGKRQCLASYNRVLALLAVGWYCLLIKAYFVVSLTGECISGFVRVTDPVQYIHQTLQVLIPSLQFNDSGRITAFHLAGTCGGGEEGVPPGDYKSTVQGCINILQVWRSSQGNMFSIAANFTATLSVTYNTALTASVAVDEPIPFSSGDVLGFTPGPDPGFYFVIASTSTAGNTHTYHTYNSFATELMSVDNNRVSASPLISVEGRHITHIVFMVQGSKLLAVLYCLGLQQTAMLWTHCNKRPSLGSMFVTTCVLIL